jgi:hypothetical protein
VVAFRIGLAVETIIDDSEFERAREEAVAAFEDLPVPEPVVADGAARPAKQLRLTASGE